MQILSAGSAYTFNLVKNCSHIGLRLLHSTCCWKKKILKKIEKKRKIMNNYHFFFSKVINYKVITHLCPQGKIVTNWSLSWHILHRSLDIFVYGPPPKKYSLNCNKWWTANICLYMVTDVHMTVEKDVCLFYTVTNFIVYMYKNTNGRSALAAFNFKGGVYFSMIAWGGR